MVEVPEELVAAMTNHHGDHHGQIEENLSSEDVKAFQIFDCTLEQELAQARNHSVE